MAVVTYHGVLPAGYEITDTSLDGNLIHPGSLRRQLQLLKDRYNIISPEDFRRWLDGDLSLPSRPVLLTCDDGLRNSLTEMLPILKELGLTCLFFITGACLNQTPTMLWYEDLYLMFFGASLPIVLDLPEVGISASATQQQQRHASWWNLVMLLSQFDGEARQILLDRLRNQIGFPRRWTEELAPDSPRGSRFLVLDLAGVRQLVAAGMSIGAHSLSHPALLRAPENLAWQEISESRSVLGKALGQEVWAFAYPFGNPATVSPRELRLAEQAGFRCAFVNVGGGFGAEFRKFAVPRVHVTADMSLGEFEAHVSGLHRALRKRLMHSNDVEVFRRP